MCNSSLAISHSSLYSQDKAGCRMVGPLGKTSFPADGAGDMVELDWRSEVKW